MHLANMALIAGEPIIFDGVEFNERFRWIDVMSEAAFVVMDLDYRGRVDLGRVFLNAYLEHTGDYAGLRVLNHYLVYRALVRAKVAAIRRDQTDLSAGERDAAHASVMNHVRLALGYGQDKPTPSLTLTRGASGSGKSWLTERLVPLSGAIRVRSDVERKRIHPVASPQAGEGSSPDLYSPAATERTYARLETLARTIARAGYPVIVDATFLAREHRQRLLAAARELDLPAHILALRAPAPVLRDRVAERTLRGRDASDATPTVVEAQLERDEPLTASEAEVAICVDTSRAVDLEALAARLAEESDVASMVLLDHRRRKVLRIPDTCTGGHSSSPTGNFILKNELFPFPNWLLTLPRTPIGIREMKYLRIVAALGVPAFTAVASGDVGWGPFFFRSFIATLEVPGGYSLSQWQRDSSGRAQKEFPRHQVRNALLRLASALAALHTQGFYCRSPIAKNVYMCRRDGGEIAFYLHDFPRPRYSPHRPLSIRHACLDLARMDKWATRWLSRRERMKLLRHYLCQVFGGKVNREEQRVWLRWLTRYRRRLHRLTFVSWASHWVRRRSKQIPFVGKWWR